MKDLKEYHNKQVDKLSSLENELVGLIAEKDDSILNDKFLEWQQQRILCNTIYSEWLDDELNNIVA